MVDEKRFVEVRARVPKKLMDVLEAENYFGWRREDFFVAAVKCCIGNEISELDIHEIERIYAKYGRDIGTTCIEIEKGISKTLPIS